MSGTKSAKKEEKITSDTVDGLFTDPSEFVSHDLENSIWKITPSTVTWNVIGQTFFVTCKADKSGVFTTRQASW